jgi:hypothetical protein
MERLGAIVLFGPPTATYHWLLDHGFSPLGGLTAMIVVAPYEVMLAIFLITKLVTNPVSSLFGRNHPMVEHLTETFGALRFVAI